MRKSIEDAAHVLAERMNRIWQVSKDEMRVQEAVGAGVRLFLADAQDASASGAATESDDDVPRPISLDPVTYLEGFATQDLVVTWARGVRKQSSFSA